MHKSHIFSSNPDARDLKNNNEGSGGNSSTLFSDFKIQYDDLRLKHEKLRKDFDEINWEKKRLEIKCANSNSEYYDKEIKRIRQ